MNMNINSVFVLNQNNTPDTIQVIVDNIPGILVVKGTMEVSNMAEPHNYASQLDSLVTIGRDVAEFGAYSSNCRMNMSSCSQ